ncbi:MAG: hypothetical protein IPL63_03330 [Saprospiraceae bacterium]|nr:hypothetical protein [Saprospiraceae bacterium]MBK6566685.1 hypothetical protein [Saprospiraceae bacterium]MBK6785030.1 hypothetical protein [Saprospiraceae bacterium]MBK8081825.1 hypothetical protein [Saprospiraceae bacterium]MBK8370646.1 hypothetical protein [Saprospiraceae bacterium]
MAKYIIESAGNVNWMALFALITFMFVFLTGVYLVFMNNKTFIRKMESLPLDSNDEYPQTPSNQ